MALSVIHLWSVHPKQDTLMQTFTWTCCGRMVRPWREGFSCKHWACFVAQLVCIKLHLSTTELPCCRSHLMVFLDAVVFWLQENPLSCFWGSVLFMLVVFFCIVCNPFNEPVLLNNWLYFRRIPSS